MVCQGLETYDDHVFLLYQVLKWHYPSITTGLSQGTEGQNVFITSKINLILKKGLHFIF